MTIIVLGAGGRVGREIVAQAAHRELVGPDRAQLDITDARAVTAMLVFYNATVVINAAAWTAIDRAECEPGVAWVANRDGPAVLAASCAEAGVVLLQRAPRPANSSLDCGRIHTHFGIRQSSLLVGLRQVFHIWRRST